MKVPSRLTEKILSALQIAKLTGDIRTGLFQVMKAVERDKVKYVILALNARPRNNKLKKKFLALRLMCDDKKIFVFDSSTQEELGRIAGLRTSAACIAIVKPDRSESLFKSAAQEMREEVHI